MRHNDRMYQSQIKDLNRRISAMKAAILDKDDLILRLKNRIEFLEALNRKENNERDGQKEGGTAFLPEKF